jgi:hypothetical protein
VRRRPRSLRRHRRVAGPADARKTGPGAGECLKPGALRGVIRFDGDIVAALDVVWDAAR